MDCMTKISALPCCHCRHRRFRLSFLLLLLLLGGFTLFCIISLHRLHHFSQKASVQPDSRWSPGSRRQVASTACRLPSSLLTRGVTAAPASRLAPLICPDHFMLTALEPNRSFSLAQHLPTRAWLRHGRIRISRPATGVGVGVSTTGHQFTCSLFPIHRMDDYRSYYGEPLLGVRDGDSMPSRHGMLECKLSLTWPIVDWNSMAHRIHTRFFLCGSHPVMPAKDPPPVQETFSRPRFNVLLLGLDSLSRRQWLEMLPKTSRIIRRLMKKSNENAEQDDIPGAVEMELVNIIGDGTTAHMLALLTGLFETELPESRRFPDNRFRPVEEASQGVLKGEIANETTVDTFPWVWDRYSRLAGYATHYIEDEPHWGSFQYRLRGFGAAREPVTSYGRPCLVQAISDVKKYPRTLGCIYSRPTHEIQFESLREFFFAYSAFPRFSLTFASELSHERAELARHLDHSIEDLLSEIIAHDLTASWSRGGTEFANTLVILFSDHGARMGKARLSLHGKLEERLPYMAFILPLQFRNLWPEAVRNLFQNRKRLVTLFDLHDTLLHLLDWQMGRDYDSLQSRGVSLFTPVFETRSCADAGIAGHWCVCQVWRAVPGPKLPTASLLQLPVLQAFPSDMVEGSPGLDWPPLVKLAGRHLIVHLNRATDMIRVRSVGQLGSRLCQQLFLKEIITAEVKDVSDELTRFWNNSDYDGRVPSFMDSKAIVASSIDEIRIHAVVGPGDAHFEASLHIIGPLSASQLTPANGDDGDDAAVSFRLLDSDISRLDFYEAKVACVPSEVGQWAVLRRYCVC